MVTEGEPFALARFHDGEHAVLEGKRKRMASGWKASPGKESWLVEPLLQALCSALPGYGVATSPPCCVQPATKFFSKHVTTSPHQRTFATIFQNANYGKARRLFLDQIHRKKVVVVSSGRGDVQVPQNGVNERFDVDALVLKLLAQDKPILLSAGPVACIIAYRYWKAAADAGRTVPSCIDVGSAIDFYVHGKDTRLFHSPHSPLAKHACLWEVPAKPNNKVKTGYPQDFPGVARQFALTPEQAAAKRLEVRRGMKRNANWARASIRSSRK